MSLARHSSDSMPIELPHLPMVKNIPLVFEKIAKAKIPDAFTNSFLSGTLGLKSTNDRALIGLLKRLGFLDNSGKPTNAYALLKNKGQAKKVIADGIRHGYAKLFEANESSHTLSSDQLKGLVAQVSGTEENMTNLIAGTFRALTTLPQLLRIMDEDNSWKNYFQALVRDKALITQTRLIGHTRNTVCHMSPITKEEHERVQQVMRDWFRVIAP